MMDFDAIDSKLISIGDLSTAATRDIADAITSLNVSLSISGSSQVSITLLDPNFSFARANYFQIRRDVSYRGMNFEISAVETQRSESVFPQYTLECRARPIQLMKRDKKPEAYRGMSAYDFAFAIAKRFRLNFVGEKTTKKQAIVKGKNNNSDDSVWTVLTSLAQEQQFVCFESEGTLFFCSEKFLVGKWGDPAFVYGDLKFIPFIWPEPTDPAFAKARNTYVLMDQPSVRRSDDDIKAAEGTMLVDRANGIKLRPGMTIYLGGIPDFEGLYIISDVSFAEGVPEPVQVSFKTPVEPKKENISSSGTRGQGTGTSQSTATPQLGTNQRLTVSDGQRYAVQALSKMGYTGRNANIIAKAVGAAVGKFNLKRPLAEITKFLREYPGLTAAERLYADNIYVGFVIGMPSASFGVAGGLSNTALLEKNLEYERAFSSNPTNPTPARSTSAVSGSTVVTSSEAAVSTGATVRDAIPTQPLPSSVPTNIDSFIQKQKPSGMSAASMRAAQSEVKTQAQEIWKLNRSQRIARYTSLAKKWSAKENRFKYNALRQPPVFNVLLPIVSDSPLTLFPSVDQGSTTDRNSAPLPYSL